MRITFNPLQTNYQNVRGFTRQRPLNRLRLAASNLIVAHSSREAFARVCNGEFLAGTGSTHCRGIMAAQASEARLSQELSLWLQRARTEEQRSETAENVGILVAKKYWQLTCDNVWFTCSIVV